MTLRVAVFVRAGAQTQNAGQAAGVSTHSSVEED